MSSVGAAKNTARYIIDQQFFPIGRMEQVSVKYPIRTIDVSDGNIRWIDLDLLLQFSGETFHTLQGSFPESVKFSCAWCGCKCEWKYQAYVKAYGDEDRKMILPSCCGLHKVYVDLTVMYPCCSKPLEQKDGIEVEMGKRFIPRLGSLARREVINSLERLSVSGDTLKQVLDKNSISGVRDHWAKLFDYEDDLPFYKYRDVMDFVSKK